VYSKVFIKNCVDNMLMFEKWRSINNNTALLINN